MHPLGRKRDLFDAISCFVRGYNYMTPFVFEEYVISDNAVLTIIDIENIDEATKAALDVNFVLICEGNSGSSLSTVKMRVRNLFSSNSILCPLLYSTYYTPRLSRPQESKQEEIALFISNPIRLSHI